VRNPLMNDTRHPKITPEHLARKAIVYLRQSSERQVQHNKESQLLQYALADRARAMGWQDVEVVDTDLGMSASMGAVRRAGFDGVVAAVVRGEVGIIFSREASRLARTDKDFCHLLEVCQVFGTLLGDGEQIYDPAGMDDQLILGIKGTMSVVELRVLRMRLLQGARNKAERGELVRLLPPGYEYDGDGRVALDPDERVRAAMASVFEVFRRTWSARQTYLWFRTEGLELPVRNAAGRRERLVWRVPTQSFILSVLHNPWYAGVYTWGRRPVEVVWQDGRLCRRPGKEVRPEDCAVFIPDHHPGYITWEQYEEHRRILNRNSQLMSGGEASPVRSGSGLLAGLLRCGRCGRRIHVRYDSRHGAARYLCNGTFPAGGQYCLGFGGAGVDRQFAAELLRVLSPLGLEASLEALNRRGSAHEEEQRSLRLQLEQLEYQAQRAFEQYDCTDPRNRLVAAELERRWNVKLEEVERVRAHLARLPPPEVSEDEREAITRLGRHFEQVWMAEDCPPELRKRIARTIIEEVVANHDEATDRLSFVIHWKGGHHTCFEMAKPSSSKGQATAEDDIEIIRRLAPRYGDEDITRVLTRLGRQTGKGKGWTSERVKSARVRAGIPGRKHTLADPDVLAMTQAARVCGVSDTTIRRLVEAGLLINHQTIPWAPWEIHRADLDAEPVCGAIAHLKATGKLVLDPVRPDVQPGLFQ